MMSRSTTIKQEAIEFLKAGLLGTVTYGFQEKRSIGLSLHCIYSSRDLVGVSAANDDDPGRVRPGADISGASIFGSYLTYSDAWNQLTTGEQREEFSKESAILAD